MWGVKMKEPAYLSGWRSNGSERASTPAPTTETNQLISMPFTIAAPVTPVNVM